MKIRAGYNISYDCPQPTPMIITLSVHPSRRDDLITNDDLNAHPALAPNNEYLDGFGNICHVVQAPAGKLTISSDFIIRDSGEPDAVAPEAKQHPMEALPVDTLVYLMGSRYCETDRLSELAWAKFATCAERLDPGADDLRLRARASHLRLSSRQADQDRLRSL